MFYVPCWIVVFRRKLVGIGRVRHGLYYLLHCSSDLLPILSSEDKICIVFLQFSLKDKNCNEIHILKAWNKVSNSSSIFISKIRAYFNLRKLLIPYLRQFSCRHSICHICPLAKQMRSIFLISKSYATNLHPYGYIGSLLYSNHNGAKYFVNIVDDHCRLLGHTLRSLKLKHLLLSNVF